MRRLDPHCFFPDPSNLDGEWLTRLDVSADTRRRYLRLSQVERRKLEGDRLLFEEYMRHGLIQKGRGETGLIGRGADDLDRSWLKKGDGRAVDFKSALKVLNAYAAYQKWVKQFDANGLVILDIIIPYWFKGWAEIKYKYNGPGFFQLRITHKEPSFGKLGDVSWANLEIRLTEQEITGWATLDDFKKNPWRYLAAKRDWPRLYGWTSRNGEVQPVDSLGLVSYLRYSCERSVGKGSFPQRRVFSGGADTISICSDSEIVLNIPRPKVGEIQKFLNQLLAQGYFEHRIPRTAWQLEFKVAEDLMHVSVASVGCGHSRFLGLIFVGQD